MQKRKSIKISQINMMPANNTEHAYMAHATKNPTQHISGSFVSNDSDSKHNVTITDKPAH